MTEDTLNAADAFAAIGNEHRVAMLRVLMDAYQTGETPLSYSALMSRVGMSDSGQFNYHLQQLLGRFIAEREDGYALTYAGRTVASAIASGTLDDSATLDPEPADGTCYSCGEASLVLRYPDTRVRVTCTSCGEEVVHIQFPPAAVTDRTVAELKRDFDRWERSWRSLAGDGICPECGGTMPGELAREAGTPTTGNVAVRAVHSCDRCWVRTFYPPGLLLLNHPAVVSFFWRQGVDIRDVPLWQLDWALSDQHQTVLDEDPLSVRIDIADGKTTLSAVIDDSLSVESIREVRNG